MRAIILAVIGWSGTVAQGLAGDAVFSFSWQGGGGYAMHGALSFDDDLIGEGLVTEADVQCFVVEGSRGGEPIGRWVLGMLTEETTWEVSFNPDWPGFLVYSRFSPSPQEWNMNGFGTDCGDGGFGFNIGNLAQDLCLDGDLLEESRVPPETPMPAVRDDGYVFPTDACPGPLLMGALE